MPHGRALLSLFLLTTIAACGDNPSSPVDAPVGPSIDAPTGPDIDAPGDPGDDASTPGDDAGMEPGSPDAPTGPDFDAGTPEPDAPGPIDGGTPAPDAPTGPVDGGTPDAPTDGNPGGGDPTLGSWSTDFALPGVSGSGSRVEAIALGPNNSAYVGGIFSDAAGVPANNVALWTGSDWRALGNGINGWVRGLRLDSHGLLWAATSTNSGTGTVERWNGTAWATVGDADSAVTDIAVVGESIVVVGGFTTISGVAAEGVAYFDATGWHGTGSATDGIVTAVAPNGSGFCVAGIFSTIGGVPAENAGCWNGTTWSPLGVGLPGGIAILAQSPGGTWYAGGTLNFDFGFGDYRAGIGVLNGNTWEPLGGGIDNGFINEVRGIAFAGDEVLIGGCFVTANREDPVLARFLARWSKTSGWSELAGGLVNDVGVFLPSIEGGNDLVVGPDGTLWIGGLFTQAGGTPAVNIARAPSLTAPVALIGSHPVLGVGGFVDGVAAAPNGDIIAGGAFNYAGGTPVSSIGRFDGTKWTDLGNGLTGIVRDVLVRADGTIAVTGDLVFQGDNTAFVQSTAAGWAMPGGRVHGLGRSIIEKDGALWLGGSLFDVEGSPISNLVRLDGTTWAAVGDFDDRVTTLTVYNGQIVAGGLFSTVNGKPFRALVVREGEQWFPVGSGLDGSFVYLNAVTASPTLGLIVAGEFEGADGVATPNLARWDGQAWHDVGGGVHSPFGDGIASAVLAYGNGVFVGGGFAIAGDVMAENIAWFDGTSWYPLGDGLQDLVESMVVSNNVLYVGGPFTMAGGRTSSGIAAWTLPKE